MKQDEWEMVNGQWEREGRISFSTFQPFNRSTNLDKLLIKYFKSLGIEVYTNTKARGHQGFFLKNRIDISKNVKEERLVPTLLHEFAHYIHSKLEPDMPRTGGSLDVLFGSKGTGNREQGTSKKKQQAPNHVILNLFQDLTIEQPCDPESSSGRRKDSSSTLIIENELMLVTNFVDSNSHCHRLVTHREQLKKKIKGFEAQIKKDYPKFMRSVKFKEFDKYIKKSKAKYLLKFDRVQLISPFLRHREVFSIDKIEFDFPDMPQAFCAYIRMKSAQRKQARNSRRLNYYKKYYSKPTELFARFIEGLYIDLEKTQELAPLVFARFSELLEQGYYFELKQVFELLQEKKIGAIF